jgi:carbonic anhydrase
VVIRNAGGRARRAIFDIAVLNTLVEVTDVVVIHHTNCGLTLATDEHIRRELSELSVEEKVTEWDGRGVFR